MVSRILEKSVKPTKNAPLNRKAFSFQKSLFFLCGNNTQRETKRSKIVLEIKINKGVLLIFEKQSFQLYKVLKFHRE